MTDFRLFSRDFVEQFINIYREEECLWNPSLYEYSDKDKKNAAYERLILLCKIVEPNVDRSGVLKKINSLRTAWRRERNKRDDSKRSGKGTDDIYKPRLWYFPLLSFLDKNTAPMPSISNVESTASDYESNIHAQETQDISFTSITSPDVAFITEESSESILQPQDSTLLINTKTNKPSQLIQLRPRQPRAKKRTYEMANVQKAEKLLEIIGNKLEQPNRNETENEFDIMGKHFANKMRKLTPSMQLIAEKLINEVYFQAQMGTLSVNSTICNPSQLRK